MKNDENLKNKKKLQREECKIVNDLEKSVQHRWINLYNKKGNQFMFPQ